jgi:hypothetical protein
MSKTMPLTAKKIIKAPENMGFERQGREVAIYFYGIRTEETR